LKFRHKHRPIKNFWILSARTNGQQLHPIWIHLITLFGAYFRAQLMDRLLPEYLKRALTQSINSRAQARPSMTCQNVIINIECGYF
jgi:hypothetical protein